MVMEEQKMINIRAEEYTKKKLMKENFMAFSLLLTIPLLTTFYVLLNNSKRGVYNLVTDMDKAIPFMSIFVIPYILWYAFIILTFLYLCIKDREMYYKTLISYDIGMVVCFIIYFMFQTTVPRPEVAGSDIFSRIVMLIYKYDQPFNCFPSIHVLSCYLMIKAINESKAGNLINKILVFCVASAIILSTLFIKQHVILDAFSAMFISGIVFNFVKKIDLERILGWIKKQYSLLMMKKKLEI